MASVQFADMQSRPVEFLDFTSLTLDEFQQLVPPFEAAFQAHMAAWRLDGKPRAARQFAVYKNCPLPTSEDRLFCTPLSCFELQQTTSHFTMPVCCLANTEVVGICSITRCNNSRVVGSAQCKSSRIKSTGWRSASSKRMATRVSRVFCRCRCGDKLSGG